MTAREHAEEAARVLSEAQDEIRSAVEQSQGTVTPWDTARFATRIQASQAHAEAHALTAIALVMAGPNSQGTVIDAFEWLTEAVRAGR